MLPVASLLLSMIATAIALGAAAFSGLTLYRTFFYVKDDLLFVPAVTNQIQPQLKMVTDIRFAVLNKGNRDALLIAAEMVLWHLRGKQWYHLNSLTKCDSVPVVIKPGAMLALHLPMPTVLPERLHYSHELWSGNSVFVGLRTVAVDSTGKLHDTAFQVCQAWAHPTENDNLEGVKLFSGKQYHLFRDTPYPLELEPPS